MVKNDKKPIFLLNTTFTNSKSNISIVIHNVNVRHWDVTAISVQAAEISRS